MRNKLALAFCPLSTLLCLAATAAASCPLPLPGYTIAGRVTDYAHIAYDADQQVEVRVKTTDGRLLAKASTATRGMTSYNFVVSVPVADKAADGCVTPDTAVEVEFVDPDGKVFAGLVTKGDSKVGKPGGITRLNVALGTDANGNGVPDEYEDSIAFLMWQHGKSVYDPDADWDGDGVSNRDEYIAGTGIFDKDNRFTVRQMAVREGMDDYVKLEFPVNQGRSYTVDTATELEPSKWSPTEFVDPNGVVGTHLNTGGTETGTRTIFVRKDGPVRFWKLNVE